METLVLISGGLDSAVLLAHEATRGRVHPLYVSVGLSWETAERAMLERLLASLTLDARIAPLSSVEFSMRDIYAPAHWAIRGTPPRYDTPDEDVYLLGRNVVLLTKAGAIAAAKRLPRIAIGPLAGNPFPDATSAFFAAMGKALSLGLDHPTEIAAPFSSMHKEDVIKIGASLGVPLELTLSCMSPVRDFGGSRDSNLPATSGSVDPAGSIASGILPRHCGLCSKCRERRDGFAAAGVVDPTVYSSLAPR